MTVETIKQSDKFIRSSLVLDKVKNVYKEYLSFPNSENSEFITKELSKIPELEKIVKNLPVYTKYNYGKISNSLRYKTHCLLLRADSPKCTIEQENTFYLFLYTDGYQSATSKVQFFSITKG